MSFSSNVPTSQQKTSTNSRDINNNMPATMPGRHLLKWSSACKQYHFGGRSSPHPRYLTSSSSTPPTDSIPRNSRWLEEQKLRLGRCITFGLDAPQIQEAARISKVLGEEWKGLVAGVDGFVTGGQVPSAWEEKVVWGEMVSANEYALSTK